MAKRPATSAPAVSDRVTRSKSKQVDSKISSEVPVAKKAKKAAPKVVKPAADVEPSEAVDDSKGTSVIVIEHCKQCKCFERKATQFKKSCEEKMSSIIVQFNPEKPRRGCFEIRDKNGKIFFSLLELKRPFKQLKEADLTPVVAEVVKSLD